MCNLYGYWGAVRKQKGTHSRNHFWLSLRIVPACFQFLQPRANGALVCSSHISHKYHQHRKMDKYSRFPPTREQLSNNLSITFPIDSANSLMYDLEKYGCSVSIPLVKPPLQTTWYSWVRTKLPEKTHYEPFAGCETHHSWLDGIWTGLISGQPLCWLRYITFTYVCMFMCVPACMYRACLLSLLFLQRYIFIKL